LRLGDAARITALGVSAGVAPSLALTRSIEAGLLGVVPSDARLLAGLATGLVAAGLVSAYPPARRASSVDPAVVLRAQ
jgi:hypothetical protein